MQHELTTKTEKIEKISRLIKGIKSSMLTTVTDDGVLHSRPMMHRELDGEGNLWYMTGRSTGKIVSILHDAHVNVGYAEEKTSRYVSLSGRAEIIADQERIKKFWTVFDKAFWPAGPTDPDIVLLKVHVESAEFWDSPDSKVAQAFKFASAILTGDHYKSSPGENQRFDLQ